MDKNSKTMERKNIFLLCAISLFIAYATCSCQELNCSNEIINDLDDFERSGKEIKINFTELKEINSQSDSSVIITSELLKRYYFVNRMKATNDLLNSSVVEIKAKSPTLIFFVICQTDGLFNWVKGSLTYNEDQIPMELLINENEEKIKYDTLQLPFWYYLKVKQFMD